MLTDVIPYTPPERKLMRGTGREERGRGKDEDGSATSAFFFVFMVMV